MTPRAASRFSLVHVGLTLLLAGACASSRPATPEPGSTASATAAVGYTRPPELGDDWRTAEPADIGLGRVPLERMSAAIREGREYRNVHSLLIVRGDRLVYEEYFAGEDVRRGQGAQGHVVFDRTIRHDLRSVTKSVVSALLGIALGDGADSALARPVLDFFPEHADLATIERRAVTLRHVLDMTAGLEWNERISYSDPRNDEVRMNSDADPIRFVLARPVVTPPGSTWNYSGGLTQVLGAVAERVSGRPLVELARERLFGPLGITDVEWVSIANGDASAASGLRLRPRDLARIGLLYRQGGRWEGRQIVPEAWVLRSQERSVGIPDSIAELSPDGVREQGYAMQWWPGRYRMPYGSFTVVAANGNGGQRIAIVPELDLTVVHHAGRYNTGSDFERLLAERILPWAAGQDTSYAFSDPRPVRMLAPGELRLVPLDSAARAQYTGEYAYEGQPLRVLERDGLLQVLAPWEDARTPLHLLPLGDHRFAYGMIVDGAAVKQYWPEYRLDFELENGRAVRVLDVDSDGQVFGTATRVP